MMTYEHALEVLKKGRMWDEKKRVRKVSLNTLLVDLGKCATDGHYRIGVKLHATYVVIIRSDGLYELDSGGWRTVTTKVRINDYGPVTLWSKDGEWYYGHMIGVGSERGAKKAWLAEHRFVDGMIFDSSGKLVGPQALEIASGRMWDELGKAVQYDARRS